MRDGLVSFRDYCGMRIERLEARQFDARLARQIAVLLGRAFTDERHLRDYSAERHEELDDAVRRVHEAPPPPGELMPGAYLENFPTLRNLNRPADSRRECEHFVAIADGYVASHAALFAQFFRFEDIEATAGYIEDVATDPLHLGRGLASAAMHAAEARAREIKLDLLGLATGIMPFYERLGWLPWQGGHTFQVADFGLSYPDEPLMLLPLTPRGAALATRSGQMLSWRLWRWDERPDVS